MSYIWRCLRVTILVGVAMSCVGVVSAHAQQPDGGCTMKCKCSQEGCGCEMEGGTGSSCEATGTDCNTQPCNPNLYFASAFVAPDGSVLSHAYTRIYDEALFVKAQSRSWEVLPNGISVAKNCAGVIVDRFVDRHRASMLRVQSRVLSAQS